MSLSANQTQADDYARVQRVECPAAAGGPAAPGGRVLGSRADLAWRVAGGGQAVLDRGVPLSARRVARPVLVPGCLRRRAQPHGLRPTGARPGGRAACGAHAPQRGAVAEISQINLELLRRRALE